MKSNLKITIFFFAWMILVSPMLAFTSVNNNEPSKVESCCGMDSKHDSTKDNDNACKSKDCEKGCKDNCNTNACYTPSTIMLTFVKNNSNSIETPSFFNLKLDNKYYQSLHIQDVSHRFWHPPKHIS